MMRRNHFGCENLRRVNLPDRLLHVSELFLCLANRPYRHNQAETTSMTSYTSMTELGMERSKGKLYPVSEIYIFIYTFQCLSNIIASLQSWA